jgi:uncharacterized membrane protein YfcA
MTDPATIAWIALTFFTAGLVKGTIGLGLPIVVLAMLAATLGLKTALALLVLPGVVMNVWQALDGPHFVSNLKRLWSMWFVSVFAILAGTYALAGIDPRPVTVLLGGILTLYALMSIARPRLPPPRAWEPWLNPIVGGISGFLFGLSGVYMIPGVAYIQAIGLNRDALIQALGMTFLIITSTLGVGLTANAMMTQEIAIGSALALVPSFAGLFTGRRLRRYLPEEVFRRAFFVALAFTGLLIAYRAI